MPNDFPVDSRPSSAVWREQAAKIVEELFGATSSAHWDNLLDLREGVLRGGNWNDALDAFLRCRTQLEADHYLPFYRLRRLLTASLRLEAIDTDAKVGSLAEFLDRRPNSFAEIKRAVRREIFEHALELPAGHRVPLRVVESA